MSDSEILDQIERLYEYAKRLRDVSYSIDELDFTQFETAGTTNWSGRVKSSKFDKEYKSASDQLGKAGPEIEEAISKCQRKMRSLASLINFTKSPLKKAKAEEMAYAPIM